MRFHSRPVIRTNALLQGFLLVSVFIIQVLAPAVTCSEHLFAPAAASHHHAGEASVHQPAPLYPVDAAPETGCRLEAPGQHDALLGTIQTSAQAGSLVELSPPGNETLVLFGVVRAPTAPLAGSVAPPPRPA